MSAKVVFSKNAASDLDAIVDFISIDNERRGSSFVQELSARIVEKLSVFTESGTAVAGLRYTTFGRYVAIYAYDAGSQVATITMVTEGHGNWRKQFEEPS
jgi:plasmid stabilization system protein ParE